MDPPRLSLNPNENLADLARLDNPFIPRRWMKHMEPGIARGLTKKHCRAPGFALYSCIGMIFLPQRI